jgi:hypothetical protein
LFDGAINWSDRLWLWRLSPVCAAGSSRGGSLRPAEDNRLPDQTIHVRLPYREPMKSQFCHPLAVSLWARVFLRPVRACRCPVPLLSFRFPSGSRFSPPGASLSIPRCAAVSLLPFGLAQVCVKPEPVVLSSDYRESAPSRARVSSRSCRTVKST